MAVNYLCRLVPDQLSDAQRRQWLERWLAQAPIPGVLVPPKAVYLTYEAPQGVEEGKLAHMVARLKSQVEHLTGGEGLWSPQLEWTPWFPPAQERAFFEDQGGETKGTLACLCGADATKAPVKALHERCFQEWLPALQAVTGQQVVEPSRWPSLVAFNAEGGVVPAYWHTVGVGGGR